MNRYYSKQAGEDDARSSFGLQNGTPRPPPPWAQKWLDEARSSGTKNLTIPSMREKRAFDPITLGSLGLLGAKIVGGGAASHIGGNLLQKFMRRFPQVAEHQMASGLSHGMSGRTMHPIMERLISRGLGAESLAPYHAGQALAKTTEGLDPAARASVLRTGGRIARGTEHLSKAPIVGSAPGAIDIATAKKPGLLHRFLQKVTPTAPVGTKFENLPAWQRIIPTAIGAPLSVAHPALAGHFAINKIRESVGNSDFGKKFIANELAQGARGIPHPEWRKQVMELGLAPSTTAPREIGLAANKEYGKATGNLNQLAAARGRGPLPLPGAGEVADFAKGVHDKLQNRPKPVAPQAAAAGPGGGLSKMLMLGGGMYALNRAMNNDDQGQRY